MSQELYNNFRSEFMAQRRQRPMMVSAIQQFKKSLDMATYPIDTSTYVDQFLFEIDKWINTHTRCKFYGLDTFPRRDSILGTTHSLDELHYIYGKKLVVYKGEYKYHRRLTDHKIRQIDHYRQIGTGDVFVLSYPSCITTGTIEEYNDMLDWCYGIGVPVHIDGAWFGCCRNFEADVSHPAIKTVSVSLSKSLSLGSQRIGIRYSRKRINGPIAIMNDFRYANVSDMWLGINFMHKFGVDYYWQNYEHLYEKVCKDFDLMPGNAIHVAFDSDKQPVGVRTPLRFLIDGYWDEHGTNSSLTNIEGQEK